MDPNNSPPGVCRQVRMLEKSLDDEFDPERRVHGGARPGMNMDREDFIDLAAVSKSVLGKTPQQVIGGFFGITRKTRHSVSPAA